MTEQETPRPAVSSIRTEEYDHWYDIARWDDEVGEWQFIGYEYPRELAVNTLRSKRDTYPDKVFKLVRCDSVVTMMEATE